MSDHFVLAIKVIGTVCALLLGAYMALFIVATFVTAGFVSGNRGFLTQNFIVAGIGISLLLLLTYKMLRSRSLATVNYLIVMLMYCAFFVLLTSGAIGG